MNTDASLGLSWMAYRSAHVAMNKREGCELALIPPAGSTSRAHTAPNVSARNMQRLAIPPTAHVPLM